MKKTKEINMKNKNLVEEIQDEGKDEKHQIESEQKGMMMILILLRNKCLLLFLLDVSLLLDEVCRIEKNKFASN